MKNRIINGAMVIDQRNAGASVTISDNTITYIVDRWNVYENTPVTSSTVQQVTDAPTGFSYSLKYTNGTAGGAVSSTQNARIQQRIEGYNFADLMYGTANAKDIAISFWVKSSLTGTFAVAILNSAADRSYVTNYTINSANTWEQKSVTIPGDTTGTWLTTNGMALGVGFTLSCGSTRHTTANIWASGTFQSTSSQVDLTATTGATFQITGVQLERGSTASSFEYRPYGTELALCQRYYIKYTGNGLRFYGGRTESTAAAVWQCALPVEMRTVPTVSAIDVTNLAINDTSVQVACTSISTAYNSTRQIAQGFNCGTVTNIRYIFLTPTSATAAVEASAEL
jgi:hypothetical protein